MASVQQEGHFSNQNVQSFSRSSYELLATYTTSQHPALKSDQQETCLLDKSYVDSQLVPEQLQAVMNRESIHKGKHSATSPVAKKQTCSLLDYLLQVAEQKASYPITEEGEAIKNMMENAAENFCEYLRANFHLFHKCRLLRTGSTYEGVKIGKPDEFDFMIEVPSLASSDAVVFHQGLCSNSLGRIAYKVCDKDLFSDIFEFEAAHFTVKGPVEQEAFMKVIFAKLLHAIETKFIEFLPTGWEFMGISGNVTTNAEMFEMSGINAPARMAFTPRFVWHGKTFPSLKVTVDFAFAIPIVKPACDCSSAPLEKDLKGNNGSSGQTRLPTAELEKCDISSHKSTWDSTETAATLVAPEDRNDAKHDTSALYEPESQPVHLAQEEDLISIQSSVPDVFHLLLADFIWCRASFSIQEQKIMEKFNPSDGQKKCMRLVKYLRDAFIPQDYDSKTFDLKPSIPTYWLKTIMYYMYEKYRSDEMAWKADHLNDRVLEVFETLLECLQQSSLYNFFVPNYNLLSLKQPGELSALVDRVKSLLQLFYSFDRGEVSLDDMEVHECKQIRENEKVLYENRKSTLMEMLLTQAIYGTDDDYEGELQRIQCFANHYLDGVAGHKVLITERGQDILFLEDGQSVNINIEETIAFLDESRQAFEMEYVEEENVKE
ncbi:uncharacterized protein LOC144650068 [Oculina patagonica]